MRSCRLIIISTLIYVAGIVLGLVKMYEIENFDEYYYIFNINNQIKISFFNILNNNIKILFILISGSFLLGIPTFINLIINGIPLCVITQSNDVILFILPHGIFEIPAIIIAGAAGFKIPYEIVRYLAGKKEQILTKEDIKEYLMLALISIILIIIAAWVEANVTLKIAKSMLGGGG